MVFPSDSIIKTLFLLCLKNLEKTDIMTQRKGSEFSPQYLKERWEGYFEN